MSVPYSGVLPPNPSLQASCPLFMNAALSFIKAYRLKGDNVSLKKSVCDHFSSEDVELAKKVLWDHCKLDLEAAGLVYHIRRGSDRRSQISANLDDIIQAFLVLDSSDLIPPIYCEATDLLKIPSLSLDPISEKIQSNTLSLQDLATKIEQLEKKISSSSTSQNQGSYAAAASPTPFPTVPSGKTIKSPMSHNMVTTTKPPLSSDPRDCNLVLFGLPESRSIIDTKESVDEMLQFLAGKPVLVKDLFRLGKYVPSADPQNSSHRPRPVLIKLTTPWDRRLILLRKSNLRNYAIPRLFVREDVAPEHRLRQRKPKEVTSSTTGSSSIFTPNLRESDPNHVSPSAPPQPQVQPTPALPPTISSSDHSGFRKSPSPAYLVPSRPASPLRSSRPASPLHSSRSASPLHSSRPASPLHSSRSASPLRSSRPASPLHSSRSASPLRSSRPASPLHSSRPASPLHSSRPASPLRSSRSASPLRSSRPASPLRSSRSASPLRSSRPASPLRSSRSASPLRSSRPASPLRSSRPVSPLHSSRPASPLRSSRSASPADSDSSASTIVQGNATF